MASDYYWAAALDGKLSIAWFLRFWGLTGADSSVEVVAMAAGVSHIGLSDLKHIIKTIHDNPSCELKACRPGKVIHYLQVFYHPTSWIELFDMMHTAFYFRVKPSAWWGSPQQDTAGKRSRTFGTKWQNTWPLVRNHVSMANHFLWS